ncbi:hypothetical protein AAP_00205 [Ascosphaera apis ARSEF 7405]|uniref:Endoplasmic reticulum junction formation protein lunapark n=1 Tax=Ascosphaera apis ARSEF 7405 TaxID=392613 RepID=A0A168DNM0_9EURO|nr:hypothetical protein AAP_00205 [Ascosphaera apis ARSEF 7405]
MVSFWPWREHRSPTDEFEKTLSQLSEKIAHAQANLDLHRVRARRYRVIFTLYAGFSYLLITIILVLVLGWNSWGAAEYTGVAGGPVAIYSIRRVLNAYYDFRIRKDTAYLNSLQKQSAETINKLKEATKYTSTQKLLRKYASTQNARSSATSQEAGNASGKKSGGKKHRNSISVMQAQTPPPGRTGMPPPPTANIRRPSQSPSSPQPPQQQQQPPRSPGGPQTFPPSTPNRPGSAQATPHLGSPTQSPQQSSAEFAPNAFPGNVYPYQQQAQQYPASYPPYQPHWYDRLFDVLLGEDETNPKNRIALLCEKCRTVNGQAPPGAKTLEDIGRWRCGFCGAWNGVPQEQMITEKPVEDTGRRGHVRQRSQSHPVAPTSQENVAQEEHNESPTSPVDSAASPPAAEPGVTPTPLSPVSLDQETLPNVTEEGSAIEDGEDEVGDEGLEDETGEESEVDEEEEEDDDGSPLNTPTKSRTT